MNNTEWLRFMTDFAARFPSDFEWLDARPKTLAIWFRAVFSGLGYHDCMEVSLHVFKGVAAWKAYERDRIPSVYQHEVGKLRQDRRERERVDGYRHDRRARGGGIGDVLAKADEGFGDGKSMAACFRHCERMKSEGQTLAERQAYVAEYFGG
jgi:hypothetical protein